MGFMGYHKTIDMHYGSYEGEERERGAESLFKGMMAENFPNSKNETDIQIHETHVGSLSRVQLL